MEFIVKMIIIFAIFVSFFKGVISPESPYIFFLLYLLFFNSIYFLPSIIARKKKNAFAIFILNLFLGMTGIGWVVALVWAVTKEKSK